MENYLPLISDFLLQPSIAVAGISARKQTVANGVLAKLRDGKRTVYAVGRNTSSFGNEPCYPDLISLPGPVQGVFIAAGPYNIEKAVEECIALNIPRLWIHSIGGIDDAPADTASKHVVQKCKEHNITLIPGACPMMFVANADLGHRCIKWFLSMTGKL